MRHRLNKGIRKHIRKIKNRIRKDLNLSLEDYKKEINKLYQQFKHVTI